MKFNESKLEKAITELFRSQEIENFKGEYLSRKNDEEVILKKDLKDYLFKRYSNEQISNIEVEKIILMLDSLSSNDLYESNKKFIDWLSNGFQLKRDDPKKKDIFIHLIDFSEEAENFFRFVTQMEIYGFSKRIPDGIIYINGLPIVVLEFKSAIREKATIADAYAQITTRYRRDIPRLFIYNSICVISDGVNSKMGSFFAPYEFFYSWRKVTGDEKLDKNGIETLYSMVQGLFDKKRLVEVIRNFIYFPDTSIEEQKIVCRYPQYFAATKLYKNILAEQKPKGTGKGGTYFGATGCGKSFAMLFLTRILMRSSVLESPTIVLITDRNDLDDQLSKQFTNSKNFIGDSEVVSVESRKDLRDRLQDRTSGGVFLTTIQKFREDIKLLSERTNIICISDEAHRSQINLEQKIKTSSEGVRKTYGFAKYLHDSLPNATYVGFTGTPVDGTLDVFGDLVDSYTMNESVHDAITVRIVYEGRAAKVLLNNSKLQEIEEYYKKCEQEGSSDYAIEESKKASTKINLILGDPSRIKTIAKDFVDHYEKRISEGSSIIGKTMFVCNSREIALNLYNEILKIRPNWNEIIGENSLNLREKNLKKSKPIERLKLVMTRNKDKDSKKLWDLLGTKEYRKELDRQFKDPKSNFKIAIVVDMWLTGFDVPFLDSMYIDKPLRKHNLIQTISRVNRKFEDKEKGLIVDYIGLKKALNQSLADYGGDGKKNIEDIEKSTTIVFDQLDLLDRIFSKFDKTLYFYGSPLEQLQCLNLAAEFVQITHEIENRFMHFVKRLKAAYDICSGTDKFNQKEKDNIHFYFAIRSILFKLTKGDAPDTFQMNKKVEEMITKALKSDGIEEIFKLGKKEEPEIDLFDEDYLAKIEKIKLPNTKIKLLQQLLAKSISNFKKTNKAKGLDFSAKFTAILEKYNNRDENDVLKGEVLEDFTNEIINMLNDLKKETKSHEKIGIGYEEKAFYDILESLSIKYDFVYPHQKLVVLSKAVKIVVDDKVKYTDWDRREDIKAELQFDIIVLLDKHGYPPTAHDDVYKDILEQAENFKKNHP